MTREIGPGVIEFLEVGGILQIEVDARRGIARRGRLGDGASQRRFADLTRPDQRDSREYP